MPYRVRFLLARDKDLFGQVLGVFLRKVFAWQRRRARAYGIAEPQCGAVTFLQRFGSLLDAHGRYDVGNGRTLIVSRGVGSTEVALRTFADPDILVVELR